MARISRRRGFRGSYAGDAGGGIAADAGGGDAYLRPMSGKNPCRGLRDAAAPTHKGDIFRFGRTYDNESQTTFTFGQSAATNEMCILQGTYYPSADGYGIYAVPALVEH